VGASSTNPSVFGQALPSRPVSPVAPASFDSYGPGVFTVDGNPGSPIAERQHGPIDHLVAHRGR
jgi:hypothetical protein